MSDLPDVYRAVHQQGFLPIFGAESFASDMLIEACLEAGLNVIEYTLRRPDAREMIPRILERHPELYLLVGSTLDSEPIVRQMQRRQPQLLSLAQLDELGVHGFVSMMGFGERSIAAYRDRRLLMPSAMTVNEAFHQVRVGAHFIKLNGRDTDLLVRCRAAPTHGYCPLLVTGGMTLDRVPGTIEAGAMLIGTGFDLMLADQPADVTASAVASILTRYVQAVRDARRRTWPQLDATAVAPTDAWLDALPHWHPFD